MLTKENAVYGGGIIFNEEVHRYTNEADEVYTSSTGFIKNFKQEFQSDFWSKYKAVERLVNNPALWKKLKMNWLKTEDESFFFNSCKDYASPEEIEKVQKEILDEWAVNTKRSLSRGTAHHQKEEDEIRESNNFFLNWDNINIEYPNIPAGTYPELRMYNHEYKLAGTADRVDITKDGVAHILDYKTSKKIDFDSWKNPWTGSKAMMKDPISDLPDCNYIHYSLQMSLYGWMLEQLGYTVGNLTLEHIILDPEDDVTVLKRESHDCLYLKTAIEQMIKYMYF